MLWLLQTMGSTFPVGGFQHSFGLETYIKGGKITNVEMLKEYFTHFLKHNLLQFEGLAFAKAHKLGMLDQFQEVKVLDYEMTAMRLSKESKTASLKMGYALLRQADSLLMDSRIETYYIEAKGNKMLGNYCVVAGYLSSLYGATLEEALLTFIFASLNNLLQVGIKSIPLGQTEGQRMLYQLYPEITKTQQMILKDLDKDINNFMPYQDIMSMQHEVLYTRLYMS